MLLNRSSQEGQWRVGIAGWCQDNLLHVLAYKGRLQGTKTTTYYHVLSVSTSFKRPKALYCTSTSRNVWRCEQMGNRFLTRFDSYSREYWIRGLWDFGDSVNGWLVSVSRPILGIFLWSDHLFHKGFLVNHQYYTHTHNHLYVMTRWVIHSHDKWWVKTLQLLSGLQLSQTP